MLGSWHISIPTSLNLLILGSILWSTPTECAVWSWECQGAGDGANCVKVPYTALSTSSFSTCRLTCGTFASLFPRPRLATLSSDLSYFLPNNTESNVYNCPPNVCGLVDQAISIMFSTLSLSLQLQSADTSIQNNKLIVNVFVELEDDELTLNTDESYTLDISTFWTPPTITTANITANTFFGVRHALETLSQLIDTIDDKSGYQMVSSGSIIDTPAYPYRGVIVDTARNFMSVEVIKKIIDAMSYHKLNRFHWHITESQSFPMEISALPNMTLYGAYSPEKIYSAQDIIEVVDYAKPRGIRIVPELDAPAHSGHGWDWGEASGLGDLVVCLDKQPWTTYCAGPPCGQLNLANEEIYNVLSQIYSEMVDTFGPLDLFHYGGDEVNLNCWNSSSEIVNWMVANNNSLDDDSYYNQWSIFQERARQLFTQANGGTVIPGIVWTSSLTEEGRAAQYLNSQDYIIQIWSGKDDHLTVELAEKGFRLIFSNYDAFYLDCGFGSWVGGGNNWCTYAGWQTVYDNNFKQNLQDMAVTDIYNSQILGGEAAIWGEEIDEFNVESRLWPRGSALAERLWADPATDYSYAESRMLSNRDRIVRRGIRADRLQPEWCAQNGGQCRDPSLPKPGE